MGKIFLTMVFLIGGVAKADVFTCTFSNPSYSVTYNLAQMQMIIEDQNGQKQMLDNVSFQIRREGKFELQQAGTILVKLNVGNNEYPYDATWGDSRGGCESDYLKRK